MHRCPSQGHRQRNALCGAVGYGAGVAKDVSNRIRDASGGPCAVCAMSRVPPPCLRLLLGSGSFRGSLHQLDFVVDVCEGLMCYVAENRMQADACGRHALSAGGLGLCLGAAGVGRHDWTLSMITSSVHVVCPDPGGWRPGADPQVVMQNPCPCLVRYGGVVDPKIRGTLRWCVGRGLGVRQLELRGMFVIARIVCSPRVPNCPGAEHTETERALCL